jgi:hypothetical protein
LLAHDHRDVAQRRQVGAARGRRPMHGGDLRDALGRHADLVVEDRAELAVIREDVRLLGQVGAAGLDHRDARQTVLPGEHLRPHVLLGGDAVVGGALHGGVVDHQHAGPAADQAHAGDDAAAGRHALVKAVAGELAEFEEGRAGVQHRRQPLARQQLTALLVQAARLLRPADQRPRAAGVQIGNPCEVGIAVARERLVGRRYGGRHHRHADGPKFLRCSRPNRCRWWSMPPSAFSSSVRRRK